MKYINIRIPRKIFIKLILIPSLIFLLIFLLFISLRGCDSENDDILKDVSDVTQSNIEFQKNTIDEVNKTEIRIYKIEKSAKNTLEGLGFEKKNN